LSVALVGCDPPAANAPPTPAAKGSGASAAHEAPRLFAARDFVSIDGLAMEDVRGLTQVTRLDALLIAIRGQHGEAPGQGEVWIDVAPDCPPVVLASVVQTAAFAGYSRQHLRAGGSWVSGWFPDRLPVQPSAGKERTRLTVASRSRVFHVVWQSSHECADVPPDAEVPADDFPGYLDHACSRWTECLQQANVSVESAVSSVDIVAAIDAAAHHGDPRSLALRLLPKAWAERQCGMPLGDDLGRAEPTEIQRVVGASFGPMRDCYERGLARNPNLSGRVAVRFVIELDGTVAGATLHESSTMPDKQVGSCVVEAFRSLVFPKPQGGQVSVVYPIQFNPSP
jgi:TonB family protein